MVEKSNVRILQKYLGGYLGLNICNSVNMLIWHEISKYVPNKENFRLLPGTRKVTYTLISKYGGILCDQSYVPCGLTSLTLNWWFRENIMIPHNLFSRFVRGVAINVYNIKWWNIVDGCSINLVLWCLRHFVFTEIINCGLVFFSNSGLFFVI